MNRILKRKVRGIKILLMGKRKIKIKAPWARAYGIYHCASSKLKSACRRQSLWRRTTEAVKTAIHPQADARGIPRRRTKDNKLLLILISALLLRILLSSRGTHLSDFNTWLAWSNRLVEIDFKKFYLSWCDYLPGYLYVLYLLGQGKNFLETLSLNVSDFLLFKSPSITADLITGYLIYKVTRNFTSQKKALFASALYLFNPAVIANSTLWGQADSFFTLLLFLFFYFLIKGNWSGSAIFFALASITKPQGLLFGGLVPLFINKKKRISQSLKFFILAGAVCLLSFIPFVSNQIIAAFIIQRFKAALNQYPYASVNAFNLWALLGKIWVSDKSLFLGLSFQTWGLTLFAISYLAIIFIVLKEKKRSFRLGLKAFTLLSLACFLFLTRVHERHLFPLFAFLTPLAAVDSVGLLVLIFYSVFYVLNLAYAYILLIQASHQILSPAAISFISLLAVSVFVLLTIYFYRWLNLRHSGEDPEHSGDDSRISITSRLQNFIKNPLFLVIGLAFLIRIVNLSHPPKHIFDEVYHAFTAQEMLKGNVAAWEWWNNPPKDFAYEWTHPPLAKLLIGFFVLIFGHNSFGWRAGSVFFGVGSVFLTFLLAKSLFKNERVALLSSLLLNFEGLFFTITRIGMAESYFLFFCLLAVYLALRKQFVFSGFALGLAISTKWTGVYLLPILSLIYIRHLYQRGGKAFLDLRNWLLFAGGCLLFPITIYLLVYLPFLLDHPFSKFIALQKQMWWYHIRLKATHPYQSAAYTWPINYRPVWIYVKYGKETIENIYTLGSPIIFWSGLAAIPYLILQILKKWDFNLLVLLILYFSFWVPWIFSPRIMFLYHYLPAVPFLCIAIAWVLEKMMRRRYLKLFAFLYLFISISIFVFFYPHLTGLAVPLWLDKLYYWFPSWK